MILCLVTDRRRLGTAVGAPENDWIEVLRSPGRGRGQGRGGLIQVREPDLGPRELTDLVRSLVRASRPRRRGFW